jgi:peptide-methionine (R)-S-oxide reductase
MKDGEIKHKLSPAQVSVMQHRVTEPPYFGKYWDHFEKGIYRCAACDTALFSSEEKFDSKTGWPSFKKPLNERDLQFKSEAGPDDKVELRCKKCKSHLGYVIAGEVPYYRINSVCLLFEAAPPTVATIVDPLAKDPTAKKDSPTEQELPVIEMDAEHDSSWSIPQILGGLVVGIILGVSATAWYSRDTTTPGPDTAATSTTEMATTTAATTSRDEEAVQEAPQTKQTPAQTPEPPVDTIDTTPVPQNTSTSTQ